VVGLLLGGTGGGQLPKEAAARSLLVVMAVLLLVMLTIRMLKRIGAMPTLPIYGTAGAIYSVT
jgi:hypothetical protein